MAFFSKNVPLSESAAHMVRTDESAKTISSDQAALRYSTADLGPWLDDHPVTRENVEGLETEHRLNEDGGSHGFASVESARERKGAAETDLLRTQERYRDARIALPDSVLAPLKSAAEAAQRGLMAAQQNQKRYTRRANDSRKLLDAVRAYIGQQFVATGKEPVAVNVSVPSGDLRALIEDQRAKQGTLRDEMRRIEKAPAPLADVEAALFQQVDSTAANAMPRVGRGKRAELFWPITAVHAEPTASGEIPHAPDANAMFAYLAGDAIKASIHTQLLDRYATLDEPLTDAQKRKKLADLRAQFLESERIECAAIWAAKAQRIDVQFRPDTSPEAILGVK